MIILIALFLYLQNLTKLPQISILPPAPVQNIVQPQKTHLNRKSVKKSVAGKTASGNKKSYDWTPLFQEICPDQMHILPKVCKAENQKGNPDAVNVNTDGSRDYGICSMNQVHIKRCGNIKDPRTNIQCACTIMREQGKNAWTEGRKIQMTGSGEVLP